MAEYKYPAKSRAFNKHIDYDIMVVDWNKKIYWENRDFNVLRNYIRRQFKVVTEEDPECPSTMDTPNPQMYMEQCPLKTSRTDALPGEMTKDPQQNGSRGRGTILP